MIDSDDSLPLGHLQIRLVYRRLLSNYERTTTTRTRTRRRVSYPLLLEVIITHVSPRTPSQSLEQKLCLQVENYFTDENLKGDTFLMKNMGSDGYGKK